MASVGASVPPVGVIWIGKGSGPIGPRWMTVGR